MNQNDRESHENSSKGRFNVHFVSDQNKEIQYALNVRQFSTKKKTMKKK
jgi:hypothetical protein